MPTTPHIPMEQLLLYALITPDRATELRNLSAARDRLVADLHATKMALNRVYGEIDWLIGRVAALATLPRNREDWTEKDQRLVRNLGTFVAVGNALLKLDNAYADDATA